MFYDPLFNDDFFDAEDLWEQSESFYPQDYQQTSDTVVFHPSDISTDFLKAIYEGKGWDVVNDPFVEPDMVEELIEAHDRIVCLGHGSPAGLFGGSNFLIHAGLVSLLREKNMVSVWCHADQFMDKFGLNGFYSGMFVSEIEEARVCGIVDTDEKLIKDSNDHFASTLGKHVDSDKILEAVKREYVNENDPVISFNQARLYSR